MEEKGEDEEAEHLYRQLADQKEKTYGVAFSLQQKVGEKLTELLKKRKIKRTKT